jgi:hypothetical protein
MKKALCVGINDYPGSSSDLKGCVNDAHDWEDLLQSFGFETEKILDSQATRSNILTQFETLVTSAEAEDVIIFTYSGHGTQVMDTSGDESDGYDEALYVYDGVLRDDEFREIITKLQPGVHCAIIADSCFSGTVTRVLKASSTRGNPRFVSTETIPPGTPRIHAFLSEEDMLEILVTGCDDDEYSYDAYINGRWNGAMSANAISVIKENQDVTYSTFYSRLREFLPSSQYPQTPQLEGSTDNKNRKLFKPMSEPIPDPGPGPDPGPDPGDTNWFTKYWWAIFGGIVAIVAAWLSC